MSVLIFTFFLNIIAIAMTENIKIIPAMCKAGDPLFYTEDGLQTLTIPRILSALIKTTIPCMNKYSSLKVRRKSGAVDLEICYDQIGLKTIYVKYEIDGVSLKGFKTVIVPPRATVYLHLYPENIACYYTQNHQAALFQKVYKTEGAITESSFLTKGYLASHADFSENYKQLGTFFYANITPQWQSINKHEWLLIESAIRSYAIETGKKLEVHAGTHGQLLLAGNPVFLDAGGHQLPVARWIWKVVVDRQADAGIAFVCSNDPFDRKEQPPCGGSHGSRVVLDHCAGYKWENLSSSHRVPSVFCCTVSQLKNAIPEAGDVDDAEEVLKRIPTADDLMAVLDDVANTIEDESHEKEEKEVDETGTVDTNRPVTTIGIGNGRPGPWLNVRPRSVGVVHHDKLPKIDRPQPVTV